VKNKNQEISQNGGKLQQLLEKKKRELKFGKKALLKFQIKGEIVFEEKCR
jgi:hypothetical protein